MVGKERKSTRDEEKKLRRGKKRVKYGDLPCSSPFPSSRPSSKIPPERSGDP